MTENHLRLTWSPETIDAKFKLTTASIYNWLNQGQLAFDLQDLLDRNCWRQHIQEKRRQYLTGTSIEQRPVTVNQRQEFGHWEVDTVLSSRGPGLFSDLWGTAELLILDSESSRSNLHKSLNQTFANFMQRFDSTVKSITVDHGKELAQYHSLEQRYGLAFLFLSSLFALGKRQQ